MSPWRPLEDDRAAGPRRVGESLDRITKKLGAGKASALGAVFSRWDTIVGPAVAAHAKPLSLREGVLRVAVDEPGWATQLRYLAPTVIARCADAAGPGVVTQIEVSVRG